MAQQCVMLKILLKALGPYAYGVLQEIDICFHEKA
jgi:hypothetical protein